MPTLADVTARDLMQTEVVTLDADASVEEAVSVLEDYRITGAPVVDGGGNLVGVFSVSDIARREHVGDGRIRSERGAWFETNPLAASDDGGWEREFGAREDYSPDVLGRETVGEWMHRGVITVAPEARVKEVCELLTRESIHRVLVVEDGSLAGLVSTVDIVRWLAAQL